MCPTYPAAVSPLADDLAAVYEPLAPARLLEFLDSRGCERVSVSSEEFVTQGANILAVRPRVLVVAAENPQFVADLRERGCEVHEFAGAELSQGRRRTHLLDAAVVAGSVSDAD